MERRVEEGIEGQAWINREVGRDVGIGKIVGSRGRKSGEGRYVRERGEGGKGVARQLRGRKESVKQEDRK